MIKKITTLVFAWTFCLIGAVAIAQPVSHDWAVDMGGQSTSNDYLALTNDAQGNTYIVGDFEGSKSFGPFTLMATGTKEVFVAMYNSAGVCQWALKGGANFSTASAGGITYSGGFVYATGHFINNINFGTGNISSSGNFNDIFVVKIDPATGTAQWVNKYGGPVIDEGYTICEDGSGGVFIAGKFSGTANFGSQTLNSGNFNNLDIYLARLNSSGICSWAVKAGHVSKEDIPYDIALSPTGDVAVTGSFHSPAAFGSTTATGNPSAQDFFLANYNASNGNLKWISTGGSAGGDWGTGIGFDPSNNYYISGFIGDTATFGNITVNSDANGNIFIGKFNSSGVPQWIKSNGSNSNDSGLDIVTDFGGSSYVTGYVTATANFDGTILTGIQLRDAFVCKYSTSGTLRWVSRIGGPGIDTGKSLALNSNGKVTVAGEFFGNVNVDGTVISAPFNERAVFLTRMGGGTVGLNEDKANSLSIYPNPAKDVVTIILPDMNDAMVTLEIIDIQGKIVSSQPLKNITGQKNTTIDISNIAPGSYYLTLDTSNGFYRSRLVVAE